MFRDGSSICSSVWRLQPKWRMQQRVQWRVHDSPHLLTDGVRKPLHILCDALVGVRETCGAGRRHQMMRVGNPSWLAAGNAAVQLRKTLRSHVLQQPQQARQRQQATTFLTNVTVLSRPQLQTQAHLPAWMPSSMRGVMCRLHAGSASAAA